MLLQNKPCSGYGCFSTILDEDAVFQDMFIDGDTLTVISYLNDRKNVLYPKGMEQRMFMPPIVSYNNFTRCSVYDISDRENPFIIRQLDVDGTYLSSRKIGDIVYMVTNKYAYIYDDKPVVPMLRDTALGEEYCAISLDEISYFPGFNENNYITVSSIDVFAPEKTALSTTILGGGQNIYVSEENMYIAANNYNNGPATIIYKFALNHGTVAFTNQGSVSGYIINQFSMDEYKGNFRIATTEYKNGQSSNSLFILDEAWYSVAALLTLPGRDHLFHRFMDRDTWSPLKWWTPLCYGFKRY